MKTLIALATILILAGAAFYACAADAVAGVKAEAPAKSYLTGITVSPYYTVAFESFDRKAREGGGIEAALPLSKTVSFVTFLESDNWSDQAIDRAGAGIQLSGKLGRLRPFGRLGFGYTFDGGSGIAEDAFYLRPQFGAILPFYEEGDFSAGLTASWALDVGLDGHTAQRLFGGLSLSYKF